MTPCSLVGLSVNVRGSALQFIAASLEICTCNSTTHMCAEHFSLQYAPRESILSQIFTEFSFIGDHFYSPNKLKKQKLN